MVWTLFSVESMKKHWGKNNLIVLFGLIVLLISLPASAGPVKEVSYLYKLSTFTGTASVGQWPKLRLDRTNSEIYALSGDEIRVFDKNGMEIYQIALVDDDAQAKEQLFVTDAAVKKNGDILYLTLSYDKGKILSSLVVANFRGDLLSRFEPRNFPPDLSGFQADRMLNLDGLLYLANLSEMRIVVIDEEGSFQRAYEIKPLLLKNRNEELSRSRRKNASIPEEDLEMGDFAVDRGGNIVFTIPAAGSAYRLTPDLQLQLISSRGSGANKFGIPAAIAADGRGNYLVSDVLRSVVMVFDKDLKYIDAFGGRSNGAASIIAPRGLVIDWNDRVYVSQVESMGVSVFQLSY